LSTAGAELMVATLDGIESGQLETREQPADGVSLAPKITPADAEVEWRKPAVAIGRQIRACTPEPGAWTQLDGVRIKLWPVTPASGSPASGSPASGSPTSGSPTSGPPASGPPASGSPAPESSGSGPLAPGELRVTGARGQAGYVLVGTGSTPVVLGDVQANGKRRMPAGDWARGLRLDGRSGVLG
jgi:methionyl-tRNA formyltransferase